MWFAYALTFFCDAMLYYGALGCLGLLSGCGARLWLAPAFLLAGCWLCGRLTGKGRWWLRYAPLLASAAAMIAPGNLAGRLATLPMAVYMPLYVYYNRRPPDYDYAADRFRHSLLVAGGVMLLSAFFRARSWTQGLPWLFLYFTLSMALLRLLRHDGAVIRSRRFRALNAGGVALVCAAGFGLSQPGIVGALARAWRWLADNVLLNLLALVLFVIQWVLYALAWVASKLFPALGPDALPGDPGFRAPADSQPMLREAAREIQALPPVVIFLIKAAGLALLAALAFILLRALSRRVARTDSPAGTDTRESLDDEAPRPRAAPLRRGPADGVRRQYRRALLLLRARGGRVSPTMNTLQIEQQNEALADPDALRALRAVYLPARYGDREASPEDARAAREAVERLKKNK